MKSVDDGDVDNERCRLQANTTQRYAIDTQHGIDDDTKFYLCASGLCARALVCVVYLANTNENKKMISMMGTRKPIRNRPITF